MFAFSSIFKFCAANVHICTKGHYVCRTSDNINIHPKILLHFISINFFYIIFFYYVNEFIKSGIAFEFNFFI